MVNNNNHNSSSGSRQRQGVPGAVQTLSRGGGLLSKILRDLGHAPDSGESKGGVLLNTGDAAAAVPERQEDLEAAKGES
jgi:hypothetical protein